MIEDAEEKGAIAPGQTILEPTSGNTGISLAMICAYKGYPLKVVMPDNVTPERTQLLRMYGAEIVYSDGTRGSNGAVELALELAASDPRYYMPYQYANEANPLAHYNGTAVEILDELDDVAAFVAGLGTGGTLMGNGRRLKEAFGDAVKIVAAEPMQGEPVQGLRSLDDGFIPPIIDISLLGTDPSKKASSAEDDRRNGPRISETPGEGDGRSTLRKRTGRCASLIVEKRGRGAPAQFSAARSSNRFPLKFPPRHWIERVCWPPQSTLPDTSDVFFRPCNGTDKNPLRFCCMYGSASRVNCKKENMDTRTGRRFWRECRSLAPELPPTNTRRAQPVFLVTMSLGLCRSRSAVPGLQGQNQGLRRAGKGGKAVMPIESLRLVVFAVHHECIDGQPRIVPHGPRHPTAMRLRA